MPFGLFRRTREHGVIPPGHRVYAYGDLHGRGDLFDRLRTALQRDIGQGTATRITIVGLGDVVDRGPDSARILADLVGGFHGADETILLRGNHEEMMLAFIDDPDRNGADWLSNRAAATIRSYGVAIDPSGTVGQADLVDLRDRLVAAIPAEILAALRTWPASVSIGGYFFAHAGARPGIPLDRQDPTDLTWFRYPRDTDDPRFEKVVVHGHTPVRQPFLGRNRINLDTGAVFSGELTLIALEGSTRRLIPV